MEDKQLSEVEELRQQVARLTQLNRTLEQQNAAFQDIEHSMQEQIDAMGADYAQMQPRYERYVLKFGELKFEDLPAPEVPEGYTGFDLTTMLRIRNRALGDSNIKLQDKVAELESQLEKAQQAPQDKPAISLAEIQRIKTQFNVLTEDKKKNLKALAQAKGVIDSLTKQLAEAKNNQTGSANTGISVDLIKGKDKQIQDLTRQVEELNGNNTDLLTNVHELQQSLADEKRRADGLQEKYDKDYADLLNQLQKLKEDSDVEAKKLSDELKETQASLIAAKQQLTDLIKYQRCCNDIDKLLKGLTG